jgi:hypothetical protein
MTLMLRGATAQDGRHLQTLDVGKPALTPARRRLRT